MDLSKYIEILSWIIPIELTFGLIIGIYLFPFLTKHYKSVFIYLNICLITDISSRIVGEIHGSNLYMYIIFSLIELVFFITYIQRYYLKRYNYIWIFGTILTAIYIGYELVALSQVNDY